MSVETVQAFWQKAQTDPKLRQQLQHVKTGAKDKSVAAVVRIAAAAGFVFSVSDYETALREESARQHAAGELSEQQLTEMAGGARGVPVRTDGPTYCPPC